MANTHALNSLRRMIGSILGLLVLAFCGPAVANDAYGLQSLKGKFIASEFGTFSSAPPPFNGLPLQWEATLLGAIEFDGYGGVDGEYVLTFQNSGFPVGVVSHFVFEGTYSVDPNGHLTIEGGEFGPNDPGPGPGTTVVRECYIVEAQQLVSCSITRLTSHTQGDEPRNLPVSVRGLWRRQH